MKKTTVLTLAAVCGAFALALPDWKQPLNAAYPLPQFTLTHAELTQTFAVQGCKTLSVKKTKTVPATLNDITLYDNGSYALFRYATGDTSGVPVTTVTGSWSPVAGKGSNTYYLSINTAALGDLFNELEAAGLSNCQVKYPAMTQLDILAPTSLVKKDTLVVKTKNSAASGTLQIKGKQQNDEKGTPNAIGTFSLKATLKGGTWADCSVVSC
jgi:hypothetical protein